jgi:hypothetical protein
MKNPFGSGVPCPIVEVYAIDSVLDHVQGKDALVIFDIDNTLVHTDQEIGGDAWAHWIVQQKLQQGMSPSQAIHYMFDLFSYVHDHIQVFPVEERTVHVLRALKERDIPTICLTGRPGRMIDRTQEQLKNIGCELNAPEQFVKPTSLALQYTVELAQGIVCCGIHDKGDVFSALVNRVSYHAPGKIVFIDDKKSCLESLATTCSCLSTDYTGLRYGFLDNKSLQFDHKKAEKQLAELLKLYAFEHI